MKPAALLAAALLLSGCANMVMSQRPLFVAADAKGAPVFRPGVWASPEPGCAVDLQSPMDGWPKCAHGDAIGPEGLVAPPEAPFKVLLVAGDPVVVQLALPPELAKAGKGLLPGGSDGAAVFYAAIKAAQADDMGRITAFEGWLVQCGPPPAPPRRNEDGSETHQMTRQPLPGLKVSGDHCLAARPAMVRAAAAASRAWQTDLRVTRWIRDGRN